METCETCRFGHVLWRKGDKYEYFSEHSYETRTSERYSTAISCRRYAPRGPVIEPADARGYEAFPSVSDTDWCGEYAPSPAASPAPATLDGVKPE